eukprot:03711_1
MKNERSERNLLSCEILQASPDPVGMCECGYLIGEEDAASEERYCARVLCPSECVLKVMFPNYRRIYKHIDFLCPLLCTFRKSSPHPWNQPALYFRLCIKSFCRHLPSSVSCMHILTDRL